MTSKTTLKIDLARSEERIVTLQRLVRERDAALEALRSEPEPVETKTYVVALNLEHALNIVGTGLRFDHTECLHILQQEGRREITVASFPRGEYRAVFVLDALEPPNKDEEKP